VTISFVTASKLKAYRLCPHRQKHEKYVESDATKFGNAFHDGIAVYFSGGDFPEAYRESAKKRGVPESEEPRALDCFAHVESSDRVAVVGDQIVTVESADGTVEFYGKRYFQVPMVENRWGLRGGMDLVDIRDDGRTLRIIDWKTGQGEEVDDLQLAVYALAAWRLYPGFERYETAFFYVEKGIYRATYWDTETLTGALHLVDDLAVKFLAERDWAPRLNQYCGYCSLRDGCKAFQESLKAAPELPAYAIEATVENLPRLLEARDRITAIEKAAKSIGDQLKDSVTKVLREAGPQTVDGRTHKVIEYSSSYDYDVAAIFEGVQRVIGRPPFEILSLSTGAFDAMVKGIEDKDKRAALEALKKDNGKEKGRTTKIVAEVAKRAPADSPAAEEKPKQKKEKPNLKYFVCVACGELHTERERPEKCRKCGIDASAMNESASMKDAKAFAADVAEAQKGKQS
jgi:hypothetical protein